MFYLFFQKRSRIKLSLIHIFPAFGPGDAELYLFAGMIAAVVISLRVFLFRGAGKAN